MCGIQYSKFKLLAMRGHPILNPTKPKIKQNSETYIKQKVHKSRSEAFRFSVPGETSRKRADMLHAVMKQKVGGGCYRFGTGIIRSSLGQPRECHAPLITQNKRHPRL